MSNQLFSNFSRTVDFTIFSPKKSESKFPFYIAKKKRFLKSNFIKSKSWFDAKSVEKLSVENTVSSCRNFTAIIYSQNFREINVLTTNWFDGKKFCVAEKFSLFHCARETFVLMTIFFIFATRRKLEFFRLNNSILLNKIQNSLKSLTAKLVCKNPNESLSVF